MYINIHVVYRVKRRVNGISLKTNCFCVVLFLTVCLLCLFL